MYHCAWPKVAWLPYVPWPRVTWPQRGSLGRVWCAQAQPDVAQHSPYWGHFTGSDVIKRHPTPSRVPWKGCAISDQTSPVGLPQENMGALFDIRVIYPYFLRTSPFTSYLPLSRHFIFMGSAFNNCTAIFLAFSNMFVVLCNTPRVFSITSAVSDQTEEKKNMMNELKLYHYSTWLSSIFSISFHYSTYFSYIFSISFHYSTHVSSIFSISFHYSS